MDKRFTSLIIQAAQAGQRKWGVPSSVCLAQWALESAYGRSMPAGSNNPFGIKARPGEPTVNAQTWEVENGKRVDKTQPFRKFASLEEAFEAHGKLLATSRYYTKAMSLRSNAEAFAHALTGVYATDPAYGSKLVTIMRANNLRNFDSLPAVAARPSPSPASGVVEKALNPPASPPAPAEPKKMTQEVNVFQGLINTFLNLGHGIVSSAKVVADPNVKVVTKDGKEVSGSGLGGTVSDVQRVGHEVLELVEDFNSRNLAGGIDDAMDLSKAVFRLLDRVGVRVPVVSQVVEALPDLDPVG